MFDSWANDVSVIDPGELPRRLEQLADNQPPALPNEGAARRRRIDRMERELNECAEFVNDCDRYADAVRDVQLVRGDVRVMMGAHLAKLRSRAVDRGRELHAELKAIRPNGR